MIRRVSNSPQVSPQMSAVPLHSSRAGSISRLSNVTRSGSITRIAPSTPHNRTFSTFSPVSLRRQPPETLNRSFFLPFEAAVPMQLTATPREEAFPGVSARGRLPLRENFALIKAEVLNAKRRRGRSGEFGGELRRLIDRGREELAERRGCVN
jgi:hypothetical protein